MAAAEAEATKNNWGMAIVILDSTGHIVLLEKLDNTQYGSIAVAEDKAWSALDFGHPTKVFEDLVAQGGIGLRTLALHGAAPVEGGIITDGKVVGVIGVSGGTSLQGRSSGQGGGRRGQVNQLRQLSSTEAPRWSGVTDSLFRFLPRQRVDTVSREAEPRAGGCGSEPFKPPFPHDFSRACRAGGEFSTPCCLARSSR